MRASIFFLATAPLAAARELLHLAPVHPQGYGSGGSGGSCYLGGGVVECHADKTECESGGNTFYPSGYVGSSGCCHCDSNCTHSEETAAANTCNYYDTSAGSCYAAGGVHGKMECDVTEAQCTTDGGTHYAKGTVGSSGCCYCDESCDHTLETGTDCHLNYYDVAQSDGSCYDSTTHVVTCDVGHQECHDSGAYWYKPGYMSGRSGCCHCKNSCDHTAETGANCEESWYDASPAPTTAPVAKVVAADAATATTVGVLAAAAAGAAALL